MAKITERIRGVAVSPIDGLSTMVYILRCEGGLILIDVGFTPLCIANIEEALAAVAPGAADINSGCERAPGIKDHDRMKRIISLIRSQKMGGQFPIFARP